MDNHHLSFLFCFLLLSLLFSTSLAEDDLRCLQEVKNSLNDPQSRLSSWSFTNTSVGFICHFAGVSCWNDRENRLIGLDLREFGISGNIPYSLHFCRSLQRLQLSGNSLSGVIPSQICDWLPYLTVLDLSNNALTGQIPKDLAKCSYLNSLVLNGNRLSGSIPYQVSSLDRLRTFSVVDNDLTGRVPDFNYQLEVNYSGNAGLCGGSLGRCGGGGLSRTSLALIMAVAAVLCPSFLLLIGFGLWRCYVRMNTVFFKNSLLYENIYQNSIL